LTAETAEKTKSRSPRYLSLIFCGSFEFSLVNGFYRRRHGKSFQKKLLTAETAEKTKSRSPRNPNISLLFFWFFELSLVKDFYWRGHGKSFQKKALNRRDRRRKQIEIAEKPKYFSPVFLGFLSCL